METRRSNVPQHPVPSGCYVLSSQKNQILNAYLGSCVGVTICDRQKRIGGLIHLLLPEPTNNNTLGRPENYALTGMPIFLQALVREGAAIENMEATVAGGALIGPPSEMDLHLDIGGRTFEIVENILKKGRIPINRSETGGFFACCLSLDLKTWESTIDPICMPKKSNGNQFIKLKPEQVKESIESVTSIPQIVLKIIRMLRDETYSMEDMAREVKQDQVISAKVIRLCNSAFFSQKMKIDSIDRALVLMGEKQLLQMVVSAAFEEFFSNDGQGYSLCKGGLFNHALGTAMICEKLAGMTGTISPDIAYTAGLLHDIGKVVLDQYMGDFYPLFYRRIQLDGDSLFTVERDAFGITHNEVGGTLAERWELPGNLMDVIRFHHNPEEASIDPGLTHLVYLADLLMSRFLVGQDLERLDSERLESRMKTLGFKVEQLSHIIDNIPRQLFNLPFQNSHNDGID